jgi:hypothetical protein
MLIISLLWVARRCRSDSLKKPYKSILIRQSYSFINSGSRMSSKKVLKSEAILKLIWRLLCRQEWAVHDDIEGIV